MRSAGTNFLWVGTLALVLAAIACTKGEEKIPTGPPTMDLARLEDLRPESSMELVAALEEGPLEQRRRAALAMGRIQSATYAAPLARAVDPRQPKELRRAALFALGQLGLAERAEPRQEAIDALRSALLESDGDIVTLATEALGKLAPEGASEILAPLLLHAHPAVRREAATGLFRTRFVPVWRRQVSEPPALPESAAEGLIRALGDDSPEVRRAAAHAFSRYGQVEAAAALGEALGDSDEWVRLFAARGLSRGGSASDAVKASLAKVAGRDPSPRVRTEAVAALGSLEAPAILPASTAGDDSFHVRAAYAAAWATAPEGSDVETPLRHLLEDPAPTVRAAALTAWAQRFGESGLPELQAALEDPSWMIRGATARALGRGGLAALPAIERALGDDDLRVRASALESLAEVADTTEATERIANALAIDDLALRGTAVGLLAQRRHPQRLAWLEEAYFASPGVDWVEIREGVVDALAVARDDSDDSLLRRIAAEDPASSVRARAITALTARGLTPPEALPSEPRVASPFLDAPSTMATSGHPTVVLETSKGTLHILVLADRAPVHAASFLQLVQQGFYDGLIWHRVAPNFVIQGGDPLGNGWGGPGYALRDEISPGPFLRGSVGMPKAGKDTGGCQIFITHVPTPHLDGNYTIFGQVTVGLDVIDTIEVGDQILRATVGSP